MPLIQIPPLIMYKLQRLK